LKEIKSHPNRLLIDHTKGVCTLMKSAFDEIKDIIDCENLFGISVKNMLILIKAIAYFHDLGKASVYFQKVINFSNAKVKKSLSQHAIIGAIAVVEYLIKRLGEENGNILLIAVSVIKNHHGKAGDFADIVTSLECNKEDIEEIKQKLDEDYLKLFSELTEDEVLMDIDEVIDKLDCFSDSFNDKKDENNIQNYILFSYLFSLLTWADRVDASFSGEYISERKDIPYNLVEKYRINKGFDKPKTEIDKMRNKFYFESTSNTEFDTGTIKGRTGIGKTLSLISLALKIREKIEKEMYYKPRIIYSLPFLSIIDQTGDTISKLFKNAEVPLSSDIMIQQHHLTNLEYSKDRSNSGESENYDAYLADILLNSWDSEIVLTTFVSVFTSMFTNSRNTRFFRIPGSIILLDEIQAIPPKYWKLVNETISHLTKYAGVKIIFSSATVPHPFNSSSQQLIKDEYEFDRYDVEYLPKTDIETFKELILMQTVMDLKAENKSLMIIANTVKSCMEIYKEVFETPGIEKEEVYCLSSNLPPEIRRKRIDEIKGKKGFFVLVTTQLIEAGVDVSFDYAFRDMAPLDSVLQAAGRVNRSGEKNRGKIKLIELTNSSSGRPYSWIYDSTLTNATRQVLDGHGKMSEPQIYSIGEKYFRELEKKGYEKTSEDLLKAIYEMDFEKISDFSLIDQIKGSITIPVFLELDKNAEKIWNDYCDVLKEKVSGEEKYKQIARKKQIVRSMAPYIVNHRMYLYGENNGSLLPDIQHGFCYINNDELNNYYDENTGLNPEGDGVY